VCLPATHNMADPDRSDGSAFTALFASLIVELGACGSRLSLRGGRPRLKCASSRVDHNVAALASWGIGITNLAAARPLHVPRVTRRSRSMPRSDVLTAAFFASSAVPGQVRTGSGHVAAQRNRFDLARDHRGGRDMMNRRTVLERTWSLLLLMMFSTLSTLAGCQTAPAGPDERLTVGQVQKEIRVGMSGAEVVQVLGSPNVVTTDELRREVWVYDKVATTSVSSGFVGGLLTLVFAVPYAHSSATSQQTLTVIIKFDEQKNVRDFAYHASRF
jgi:outer membrane protein assembly factor BamE (lipoprotein component of BamABCDE complex)